MLMAFKDDERLDFYGEGHADKASDLLERSLDASERVQKAVGRALGQQHRIRSSIKTSKSVATRKRIMEAATQLMQQRGGMNFQMSEVSERCHMSKGALYYYFSDKEDLVGAVFEVELEAFAQAVSTVTLEATSAMEALVGLSTVFEARLADGAPLALGMMQQLMHYQGDLEKGRSSRTAEIIEVLARQIERAKGEGMVQPEVDSTKTAIWVCGAFTFEALSGVAKAGVAKAGVAKASVAKGGTGTRAGSTRMVRQILEGVGTPSGVEAFNRLCG